MRRSLKRAARPPPRDEGERGVVSRMMKHSRPKDIRPLSFHAQTVGMRQLVG